jgi:nucleotide-binding universal stress UspA family protein
MSVVLAALDTTDVARAVLATATRFGLLTRADVEAVFVRANPPGPGTSPEWLATGADVPFHLLDGPVESTLLEALGPDEVIGAVIGARATPRGPGAVGHTALHVLEHTQKPVMVVPPGLEEAATGPFRRLLVPLEGTESSSHAVLERLRPLLVTDVELVVLHVFNDDTRPVMLDRPEEDLAILGRQFLIDHFPRPARIELCYGPVAERVVEASRDHASDLIVLSWSQDGSPGRARTVRESLESSRVPVLLLPATHGPGDGPRESRGGPDRDEGDPRPGSTT